MEVNCIKVTNIPKNFYDDYLVITFATVVEGLEVKTRVIHYDAEKATAIVDVETSEAVMKILLDYQKHPSTYDVNGKRLHVVEFTLPGLTDAFEQLKRNQVVFAECLELQCLDLADFPKTFEHVQRAAYSAMALHGDTVTLFKKFSEIARLIVKTQVPMFFDSIRLKEPSLVAGAFNEVLSCVTEMSSGADHIHSRYGALVSKIVECGKEIATAEDARKNQNRAEINKLDEQLHEAGRTLYTLQERLVERGKRRDKLLQQREGTPVETEQHKVPRDIDKAVADNRAEQPNTCDDQVSGQRLCKTPEAEGEEGPPGDTEQHKVPRDINKAVADNQSEQPNNCDDQVSGQRLCQTPKAEGEPGEEDFDMVDDDVTEQGVQKSGHGTGGDPGEESSRFPFSGWGGKIIAAASSFTTSASKTMKSAASSIKSTARHFSSDIEGERQQEKNTLQEEINKVDEQIHRIRSEEEDLNLQKRQLKDQKALKEAEKPINAEGVCNAKEVVQGVIYQLSEICEFWTTMKQNIQPLAEEEEASNVYRSATGSDSARTFFLEKMSLSLKGWERLDALCMDYVRHFQQDPVEGLGRIFAFLSAPIGQPREVIEARTSELRKAVTPIA